MKKIYCKKHCEICGKEIILNSGRQKYCGSRKNKIGCSYEAYTKYRKIYYYNNRPMYAELSRNFFRNNPNYHQNYQRNNKEKIQLRQKKYYIDNKYQLKEYNKNYKRKRRKDIKCRIIYNLRTRIWGSLKGERKKSSLKKLVGCSFEELKIYLENQFTTGMSWDNYGYYGWHIDHIKPCRDFDLFELSEQKKCFHYTNLQPLWAEDNLKKH